LGFYLPPWKKQRFNAICHTQVLHMNLVPLLTSPKRRLRNLAYISPKDAATLPAPEVKLGADKSDLRYLRYLRY
jgi:hypothetical protein